MHLHVAKHAAVGVLSVEQRQKKFDKGKGLRPLDRSDLETRYFVRVKCAAQLSGKSVMLAKDGPGMIGRKEESVRKWIS